MAYYYDPLYPSFEATRSEIQRSFVALQEKLRLQREFDLGLHSDQPIRRDRALEYEDELRYQQQLAGGFLYDRAYDRNLGDRAKYLQQQDEHQLIHLTKLERLERERLFLGIDKETRNRATTQFLVGRHPVRDLENEQDDKLIRKYEDGTRARQIKEDILKGNNSRHVSGNNFNDRRPQKERNPELSQSPYRQLDRRSPTKPFSNQKLRQFNSPIQQLPQSNIITFNKDRNNDHHRKEFLNDSLAPRFGQAQPARERPKQEKVQEQPKSARQQYKPQANVLQIKNQNIRKGDEDVGKNRGAYQILTNLDKSRKNDKSNSKYEAYLTSKESNQLSERGKSRSQIELDNSSYSKRKATPEKANKNIIWDIKPKSSSNTKRLNNNTAEQNGIIKIKNRLKLSEVVYEDSAYHNVKHQWNHLLNTYECQCRLRKQLKMKINNHPNILKKHAMVVE